MYLASLIKVECNQCTYSFHYRCDSSLTISILFLFLFFVFNEFNLPVCRETSMTWDTEIRDDVIEECNKHGGVLHIYVDKASPQGNVYVKCPSIAAAVASVNALHGRFFAG